MGVAERHGEAVPAGEDSRVDELIAEIRQLGDPAAVERVKAAVEEWSEMVMDQYMGEAEDPRTPAVRLDSLAGHGYWLIRLKVAANPNTSPTTLQRMVEEGPDNLRAAVAANPNTPSEMLENLYRKCQTHAVREGIADNPNTSSALLRELYETALEYARYTHRTRLRLRLGRNPNSPTDILVRLAGDHAQAVRDVVKTNPRQRTDAKVGLAVKLAEQYQGRPEELAEVVDNLTK